MSASIGCQGVEGRFGANEHLSLLKKAEGKLSAANRLGGNRISEGLTLGYGKEEVSDCQSWCGILGL